MTSTTTDQPYKVNGIPDLISGRIEVLVIFPTIGKGKGQQVKATANSEDSVPGIVKSIERQFVADLCKNYYESHAHRFVGQQTAFVMNALGAIKADLKALRSEMWLSVLMKSIGPQMAAIATKNPRSTFYKYDNDALEFLRAIVKYHKQKASK